MRLPERIFTAGGRRCRTPERHDLERYLKSQAILPHVWKKKMVRHGWLRHAPSGRTVQEHKRTQENSSPLPVHDHCWSTPDLPGTRYLNSPTFHMIIYLHLEYFWWSNHHSSLEQRISENRQSLCKTILPVSFKWSACYLETVSSYSGLSFEWKHLDIYSITQSVSISHCQITTSPVQKVFRSIEIQISH